MTREEAQQLFDLVAAKGDEIAYRYLDSGCECRAQLMIEALLAEGVTPGRAWALAVSNFLRVADPNRPRGAVAWRNHVAPTVRVPGEPHGILVIDPSLSRRRPLTVLEWAGRMAPKDVIEISDVPLSQEEMGERLTARVLTGGDLRAVVVLVELGRPPIPEVGGTGFCVGPDPAVDLAELCRETMRQHFAALRQRGASRD